MSDYLTNLAARSLERVASIQPRLAQRFEPPPTDVHEPSAQQPPPAFAPASDGATAHQTSFHGATLPSDTTPSHQPATPISSSHILASHQTMPPSAPGERHDAPAQHLSPTGSTRATLTSEEATLSSSAQQPGAERVGDVPETGWHVQAASKNPEPPSPSTLLIPSPASRRVAPGSPDTTATDSAEAQASRWQASEEARTPHGDSPASLNSPASLDSPASFKETRGERASQLPAATSVNAGLNAERVSHATETTRAATRRTPGALDSGAQDASVQFIRQPLEDAAMRAIVERSSTRTGALRSSVTGAEQGAESVRQSLLVPVPSDASEERASQGSNVLRGSESAASGDAMRVQVRVQPPANVNADPSAKSHTAPTIHVSIGRIEVRAVTPPAPPPRPSPARPAPKMSLDEYLRADNGGRK